MRVAAIQTTAGPDRQGNLATATGLVETAVREGAELVVLPEYFSVAGSPSFLRRNAETLSGPTVTWASQLAARWGIWLVAGTVPERPEAGADLSDGRLYNTSCLIGPTGEPKAIYRKIHLFDVGLADIMFRESATIAPGHELSVTTLAGTGPDEPPSPVLGLTICYDLRFPEPYRIMTLLGSTVIAVPAAFTAATGPAHWELLLRARAVENQVFVIGAGQVGDLPPGMPACHGHSMVVDPWGQIIAERVEATPGVITADLDFDLQQRVRSELPVLVNRRPEAYRWPDGSTRFTIEPDG